MALLLKKYAGFFGALPEPMMRKMAAVRLFNELETEELLELLSELVAGQRETVNNVLMLEAILEAHMEELLPYERVADLYALAKERHLAAITKLLLNPARSSKEAKERGLLDLSLQDQPLGMRKYMARHADRALIDRLLNDPDPTVIHNLLRNPRLTEEIALRIATRRYSSPQVFKEILACHRWQKNYRVRLAIIYNPTVPVSLSAALLPTVLDQDLADLAHEGTLSAEIRELAGAMLRERQKKTGAKE